MTIIETTKKVLADDKYLDTTILQEFEEQISNGKITVNQSRQEFGLNPIDGGDELLILVKVIVDTSQP